MAKRLKVCADGVAFDARCGGVLLDAALSQGVSLPHDCRAGRCGSCLTRVRKGVTVGGESGHPGMVYACQARVLSDLAIEIEDLPEPVTARATLAGLNELTADVVELTIRTDLPFEMLPGQYCRFAFRGFPARAYSPTAAMQGRNMAGTFNLHVQRVRGGRVSSAFGEAIKVGHSLTIEGPFGMAFHRPGQQGRLVLVASGTGFAPVYAVAEAALRENFEREMVVVAGARRIESLYMPAALGWMSAAPNVAVIATADEPQQRSRMVRAGSVVEHVPELRPSDIVFAAGGPRVVQAVTALANKAGAQINFDVFQPAEQGGGAGGLGGLWAGLSRWRSSARSPQAQPVRQPADRGLAQMA